MAIKHMQTIKRLTIVASVVFFNVGCAITSVTSLDHPVYSIACDDVESFASLRDDDKYVVNFLNSKEEILDIFWINYEGEEELIGSIPPGETLGQNTFVTHPFVARDQSGQCVAAFDSESSVLVDIR